MARDRLGVAAIKVTPHDVAEMDAIVTKAIENWGYKTEKGLDAVMVTMNDPLDSNKIARATYHLFQIPGDLEAGVGDPLYKGC